jgi:hypothetical protein
MQDLSSLAQGSLSVSSMSGGNTVSSNEAALTAPGSPPVDRVPGVGEQPDPALTWTAKTVSVYEHGSGYAPQPAMWKDTGNG